MIALLQRVLSSTVHVNDSCIAKIDTGLMVLVAVEYGDTEYDASRLAQRICGYRIFNDDDGKMNLSVTDIAGDILLVPQFTLAADTNKGMRPSFHTAADPDLGQQLFQVLTRGIIERGIRPEIGEFGANMQVSLINDGPVTFWLRTGSTPDHSGAT